MATHLYCLLTPPRPDAPPTGVLGVGQLSVRAIMSGEIEAWVSDAPPVPSPVVPREFLVARALEHNAVLDAAFATGRTPLPARFGSHIDDTAVLRGIQRQAPHLRGLLARIEGAVEMSVIIAPSMGRTLRTLESPSPQTIDATSRGAGLRYLEKVRTRIARDDRTRESLDSLAQRVSDVAGPLVRAEQRQPPARGGVLSIAHLVDRARVEAYRAALEAVESGPEWQLVVAGPRAPYSFATMELEEPA